MSRKPGLQWKVKIPEKNLHSTHLDFGGGVSIPKMNTLSKNRRRRLLNNFPEFIKIFCRKWYLMPKAVNDQLNVQKEQVSDFPSVD